MKTKSFPVQWLILGTALLYLGGAIAFNLNQEHQRTESREQERLLTQVRVVEENAVENLIAINLVLLRVRQQLQREIPGPDLNEHLALLSDTMPGVRTLLVLDVAGKVIAGNQEELIGRNFSQREYFKAPQQPVNADLLYLSPPFRTALGVFAMNVSVSTIGPRGEFTGVITATLDPSYFVTLLDSVLYAPDMRVLIVHGDGDIFTIAPARADMLGKNLAQANSLITRHKDSGQAANVFSGTVFSTGEERMVALRTVLPSKLKVDKPPIIAASRDPDQIYAAWRDDLWTQGGLFALVALVSILALYILQRRQRESNRQLEEAAQELLATHVQIRESEEKYRATIDTTDTGYVILDANGNVSDANSEYLRLSGHSALAEIVGRNSLEWTAEQDRERHTAAVEKGLQTGGVRNLEIDYVDRQGKNTPVEINATVLRRNDSLQIVALCRDVSERKHQQDLIKQLAYYDALTNLPNRRLMLERLNLGLTQAKRFRRSLAVMFMDLDYFKEINDSLGHNIGDELLKVVADRLSACVRVGDTVSRQGGDEFIIVLTEITQAEDARLVAAKIVSIMREPVPIQEHLVRVTVSIGIAVYPVDGSNDAQDLMKKADIAMYAAKSNGRDGFQVYQER